MEATAVLALVALGALAMAMRRRSGPAAPAGPARQPGRPSSPRWSERSAEKLRTVDDRIVRVLDAVVAQHDMTIITGHRSAEDQAAAYEAGRSQIKSGGAHQLNPSAAVDVAPYPIDWQDAERFELLADLIMDEAARQGALLRWGGAWSGVRNPPGGFDDLGHFELADWRSIQR